MLAFNHKTKVLAYDGVVEQQLGLFLQDMEAENVLLITDKILMEIGIVDPIIEYIEDSGVELTVFDGVLPDPPTSVIEECISIIDAEDIDILMAVGGGSAIDTMKAVNMLKFGNKPLEEMADKLEGVPNIGLPTIAIPTTSGTGSEVSIGAVITNEETERKMTLIAQAYAPTVAFLDPQMTKGMPKSITRSTGLDALFHGIEAYTTNSTNRMCDAISLEAIDMILDSLPEVIEDGENLDKRLDMSISSMMVATAFNNTYLHLGHAFGHALGSMYHIPHGESIACTMPWVMEYVADSIGDKAEVLCRAFGVDVEGIEKSEVPKVLRNAIVAFQEGVGQKKFADYEMIDEANIEKMADRVMLEQLFIPFAPKRLGKVEAIQILKDAFNHKLD